MQETICGDFQNGGLENVDNERKKISLQFTWIKILYDQSF